MAPSVPANDAERVPLSDDHGALFHGIVYPLLLGACLVVMGIRALSAGRAAALGVGLIALPLLVALLWWRWGTRLLQVAVTPAGFVVSSRRGEWFVPYAGVASTRWGHERDSRIVVVRLRQPVAGLRSFAFVASRSGAKHPVLNPVGRWMGPSHCQECGSPVLPRAWPVANLCAECAHLLYGFPACRHEFAPRGSCVLCGWDRSRSEHTRKLAQLGEASEP